MFTLMPAADYMMRVIVSAYLIRVIACLLVVSVAPSHVHVNHSIVHNSCAQCDVR